MWCAHCVTICGIAVGAFHRQMEYDTHLLGVKHFNSQSTTEYSRGNDREWSFYTAQGTFFCHFCVSSDLAKIEWPIIHQYSMGSSPWIPIQAQNRMEWYLASVAGEKCRERNPSISHDLAGRRAGTAGGQDETAWLWPMKPCESGPAFPRLFGGSASQLSFAPATSSGRESSMRE
jgi:hypothetical protein